METARIRCINVATGGGERDDRAIGRRSGSSVGQRSVGREGVEAAGPRVKPAVVPSVDGGRELGFSLEEIRSLLGLAEDDGLSCQDVDRLARGHLLDIRNRLNDLQRMASELERVIGSCSGGERGQCAILDTLRHPPS